MHICILNEFFYPDMLGGTPKVVSDLAAKLHLNHGDEITVITSCNSYRDPSVTYPAFEDWNGIRIHRVKAPHWTSKRTIQRLLGNLIFTRRAMKLMMREVKCDVVLVTTAPVTLPMAARTYFRRTGVPYVYLVYDLDPDRAVALGVAEPNGMPVRLLKRFQRQWLHSAKKVVPIGRCMRETLASRYGLPEDRVEAIEVGADADTVRPLPRDTRFRKENQLEGFVVLYSGNFGKYHDFDTILDAAKLLGAKDAGVTFVLVGRGAKKAHIEERIKSEGISNVRLFDFVSDEDYGDLLASADISLVTLEAGMEGLCVPSKFYSILASGRPTLALMSSKSEVAYAVKENDIGFVIELGDPAALAQSLTFIPRKPEELVQQGIRARTAFERSYTSDVVASRFHETLVASVEQRSEGR